MNWLTELKSVINSLELQIDNDTVNRLQKELLHIEEQFSENTEILSIIKQMQSIFRYLNSKKDKVHEDTVPILNSIAAELEKLILEPDQTQIDAILKESDQLYASLKAKILSRPLLTDTDLQELKAVILEVDWEISDSALNTFDQVTTQLLIQLKSHKILHAFLKIIHIMGRYIASRKASAHKDSIFFLHSVFENFERVVQTPKMPFQEKKQLLQRDIAAFNAFKKEISTLDFEVPAPAQAKEDIQPALSHVTGSHTFSQDIVPLQTLSDQDKSIIAPPQDSEGIVPALSGKKNRSTKHRDIMNELFTMKESPADQLLDEIHLSAIQGPDQKSGRDESTPEDLQKQGIKNITPTRMDNEPIPEIGTRLDEFFDLDTPAVTESTPVGPQEKNPEMEAVNRLKALVTIPKEVMDADALAAMAEDLDLLKSLWQEDPDKAMLLDCLTWLAGLYAKQVEKLLSPVLPHTEEAAGDSDPVDFDSALVDIQSADTQPKGVWGKFKSLFFS